MRPGSSSTIARAVGAAALLAVATGVAGCGSSSPEPSASSAPLEPTTQPYPPQAAEPRAAPPVTGTPPGQIVRVGAKPEGLIVDPATGRIAVAVASPPRLVILRGRPSIDAADPRTVALPGTARHVELAKSGGPFLVPVETANMLLQVPDGPGRIVRTKVGNHPHDAAYLNGAAYTVDEFGSTLSEVRGGKLTRQVPVDAQPGGVTAVGGTLAVTAVRAYTVEQFRQSDLQGQGAQSAGLGPSHVTHDAEGRLYIADTRGEQLIVYATRPRLKFVGRVPLGGTPLGLAVDQPHGRLWVTLSERNQVVELSLADTPKIERRIATVRDPFSDAVDPVTGRVYVASRSDGTLQVIDP
jgi:DNA-binding beta-propeller fold protein YncE